VLARVNDHLLQLQRLNRADLVHCGYAGIRLETESFTDVNFADDVAVLAEMLEILILSLQIMHDEACLLGLEINWNKTKIQGYTAPA